MSEFISGLKLNELFYHEAVKPILKRDFPGLIYSAALIGYGSDVFGYDTALSTDHMWGPRLYLFVSEADHNEYAIRITEKLSQKLPFKFMGYSTNFSAPDEENIRVLEEIEAGPVNHLVWVETIPAFFENYIGLNPNQEMSLLDWLTVPEQKLLAATAGRVYYDGLQELEPIRQKLAYYPHEVWLWLLSAQWERISQEEAFVGRCGEVGDELGSQLIAGRLVHDLMKLCFLMEQRYAPYSKWFGTAFSNLKCAAELGPVLQNVLRAAHWQERERHLSQAYQIAARLHNALNITDPLEIEVSRFHNRPYLVIHAGRFVSEIRSAIKDEAVRNIKPPIGAIDQFTDHVGILSNPQNAASVKAIFLGLSL